MLEARDAVLVVVDVQGKLAQLMHARESLVENIRRIILGAQALEIPILRLEQNPAGLGPTVPEIAELLTGSPAMAKRSFSCCGCDAFLGALRGTGRRHVLLAGIETHVCVYQTARDLLELGYAVSVVADAVSSRTAENKALGLEGIRAAGAAVTGVEMCLFEMLRVAEGDVFKRVLKIVK